MQRPIYTNVSNSNKNYGFIKMKRPFLKSKMSALKIKIINFFLKLSTYLIITWPKLFQYKKNSIQEFWAIDSLADIHSNSILHGGHLEVLGCSFEILKWVHIEILSLKNTTVYQIQCLYHQTYNWINIWHK